MEEKAWVPKTEIGKKVLDGTITSMREIMEYGVPILETNVVDHLIPQIDSEILDINRVQRRDRSGRKLRYRVIVAVGNRDGYVGIGQGKAKEVYGSIQKAVKDGKKNLIYVRRGCGSWECGCGKPHTVPFRVKGKSGSVSVTLIPAPRGIHLAAGEVASTILELAGIEDVWSRVEGRSQTTLNFAMATFEALRATNEVQAKDEKLKALGVSLEKMPSEAPKAPRVRKRGLEKIEKELKKEGAEVEELEEVVEVEELEEEPEVEGELAVESSEEVLEEESSEEAGEETVETEEKDMPSE
jgi:small subunit ribosomal protein S5